VEKTLERDGQTDRYALAITAVCIASNADRCKKLEAMSLTQLLAFSVSEFEVIAFQITGIDIETSPGICGFKKGIPGGPKSNQPPLGT